MVLDVPVAVRLDADTVSSLVGPDLARIGREHLDQGRVFELAEEDGGVAATVLDTVHKELDVWVGVVNGALTGECDCTEEGPHVVAVALAALAVHGDAAGHDDDEDERWRTLSFDQLRPEQAVADPDFRTLLAPEVDD
ncbi:hypothetical protein GCM10029964_017860 [Kibdelosporangium lantanae]